jgi:hypothetical protein
MKRKTIRLILVVLLALMTLVTLTLVDLTGFENLSGLVSAQTGGGYDLTWSTIDGGGYMFSAGGGYSLGGTVGQPDAGAMSGGGYSLAGGFWGGATAQYKIYLPVVLKQ